MHAIDEGTGSVLGTFSVTGGGQTMCGTAVRLNLSASNVESIDSSLACSILHTGISKSEKKTLLNSDKDLGEENKCMYHNIGTIGT